MCMLPVGVLPGRTDRCIIHLGCPSSAQFFFGKEAALQGTWAEAGFIGGGTLGSLSRGLPFTRASQALGHW